MKKSQIQITSPQTISNHQSNIQIAKDISSNLISSLSGNMFIFGLGLMLLNQVHSAISFGIDMAITPIINIFFLVPVGNTVDKYKHKKILIISILTRLIFLLIFALTINQFLGILKLIPVIIFVAINAISVNFINTSYSASIHELVNDSKIQKLSSLSQAAISLSAIFAPVFGIALYDVLGFEVFVITEIFSTIISFFIMLSMHFHYEKNNKKKSLKKKKIITQWEKFKQGLNYIYKHLLIKTIIFVGTIINLLAPAFIVGMPFTITNQLHAGNDPVGWIEAGIGIGLLIGSLYMNIFSKEKNFIIEIFFSLYSLSVGLFLIGVLFATTYIPKLISLIGAIISILLGFSLAVLNIIVQVKLQKTVPTKILGRVMSTYTSLTNTMMPVGVLLFTFLFQNLKNGAYIFIVISIFALIFSAIISPNLYKIIR